MAKKKRPAGVQSGIAPTEIEVRQRTLAREAEARATEEKSEEEKLYLLMNEKCKIAFEWYYAQGPERRLPAVSKQFGVSEKTVYKWSSQYKWTRLVEWRNSQVQTKVDQTIVNTIAEKVADSVASVISKNVVFVQQLRQSLDTLLQNANEDVSKGSIRVTDVYQLRTVMEMQSLALDMEMRLSQVAESAVVDKVSNVDAVGLTSEVTKALNRILDLRKLALDQYMSPATTPQIRTQAIQTAIKAEEQFRKTIFSLIGEPEGDLEDTPELAGKSDEELDAIIEQQSAKLENLTSKVIDINKRRQAQGE